MASCPAGNDCRRALGHAARAGQRGIERDQAFAEAFFALAETSPLPAVCGRVCPHPCEDACTRGRSDGAVGIATVERAIGDWAIERGLDLPRLSSEGRGSSVAVVGSGPAGLSCAYQLARRGYEVTVFEALDRLGGMLAWGIPPYRLPRDVLEAEIARIGRLGVAFAPRTRVGTDLGLDELRRRFDAVHVAIGAHRGRRLEIEGEHAPNVMPGAELLRRVLGGETLDLGAEVVVVGGGNTAVDAASVARRLGARVTIVYRRTLDAMPAIAQEVARAVEEGVRIEPSTAPVAITLDRGRVVTLTCVRTIPGEPDASGRRRPVPVEGSEHALPASFVVVAVAQEPDPSGLDPLVGRRGSIGVDDRWRTSVSRVWAGGDAVERDGGGPAGLVAVALHHGRRAAESIHAELSGETWSVPVESAVVRPEEVKVETYERRGASVVSVVAPERRIASLDLEVVSGLEPQAAADEARRCMSCGECFHCELCYLYCQDQAVRKGKPGEPYSYDLDLCQGCKKCAEECPCAFLAMR
jgi:NADPH-dependent glutamate synthase beta subunit-like oxidoreductase